jgi:hypothetical protein
MTDLTTPTPDQSGDLTETPDQPAELRVPTCSSCRRKRTLADVNDYTPMQVITGQPLGWYSGDDGEVCPECMTTMLRGGETR